MIYLQWVHICGGYYDIVEKYLNKINMLSGIENENQIFIIFKEEQLNLIRHSLDWTDYYTEIRGERDIDISLTMHSVLQTKKHLGQKLEAGRMKMLPA